MALFKKTKVDRGTVSEMIAHATFRILTDVGFQTTYVRPIREAGCQLDDVAVLREYYYLLQAGNHVVLSGRVRDPAKAADLMQRCANSMTPMLQSIGAWPGEESIQLSNEYLDRKRELVSSLEATPPDTEEEAPDALIYPVAKVTATHLLGPGRHPTDVLVLISGLFYGQVARCKRLLDHSRIT